MRTPILFLHGWAMNGATFEDAAQRLSGDFDCHAPDLPGHGSGAGDEPSLENCVAVAAEWIDRLDNPILIGWSMGATVAWRHILQHGTSGLRGLVTIDMSPRMLPDADWDLGMMDQSAEAILATSEKIEADWPRVAGSIARNMYARSSEPVLSRVATQELLLSQDPARLRPIWDDLVGTDVRAAISQIDIPYLVCTGAQSCLYREDVADWISARADGVRLERFEHSGHSLHLEEPEVFCDAIRRFVRAKRLATPIQNQEASQ